jgi:serine/threonine protein kinase
MAVLAQPVGWLSGWLALSEDKTEVHSKTKSLRRLASHKLGKADRDSSQARRRETVNIGTQEYMVPKVRLFRPRHKGDKASYTVAADMWGLGAICVRLITANPAFGPFDVRGLLEYYDHGARFDPEDALAGDGTTQEGRDFVRAIMGRDPKLRPLAHEAIEHAWMAPSWRLSSGVPNSEPRVSGYQLHNRRQPCSC